MFDDTYFTVYSWHHARRNSISTVYQIRQSIAESILMILIYQDKLVPFDTYKFNGKFSGFQEITYVAVFGAN